ncbi:unnamed protein product [Rhizophagus irregularis]|uniref:Uncharacterized protein n=1 Tax=Rhizophagus irregularis TaxID=588596 RepID=A0A2I1FSW6_9GLOM|nr:hypothetical protein RhiirA4_390475 [Rhizophagus irregularis]CAB4428856.1 unnamed protein product [Rhizophagus irregularis]
MLSKVKILLDRTEPSNRLHVLALDLETQSYLSIKISSPEEIIERNYKDILNAYMLFMIDFQTAFKAAKKSNKQFRSNSKSFKKPLLFWGSSPSEVTDEYKRIFQNYKKLKPKVRDFIPFRPKVNANKNNDQPELEKDQDKSPNDINSLTPQPEAIQSDNLEIDQNNSPNDFLQHEFIRNPSFDYFDSVYNDENLDQDNSFNSANGQPETIHFESFENSSGQNSYIDYINLQLETIPENAYLTINIGENENLFYLDQDDSSDNTHNLILQPQFENFEATFQNDNYTNNLLFPSETIHYPFADFEIDY